MTCGQITSTVATFCRITGIGRSKTYELLANGALDSVKIGKRRLILMESYSRLIKRLRADEKIARGTNDATAPPANGCSRRRNFFISICV